MKYTIRAFQFFFWTGEKGVAYTLITPADQNFSGDLVRNLVSKTTRLRLVVLKSNEKVQLSKDTGNNCRLLIISCVLLKCELNLPNLAWTSLIVSSTEFIFNNNLCESWSNTHPNLKFVGQLCYV